MIVRLRDRVAVAAEPIARQCIAPQHRTIGSLAVISQPQGQRRAYVEVDRFVIIADMDDVALHGVRMSIGGVALAQNAFVPVGEWRRSRFLTDEPRPGALTRGLVEVAVNNDVARFGHGSNSYVARRGG